MKTIVKKFLLNLISHTAVVVFMLSLIKFFEIEYDIIDEHYESIVFFALILFLLNVTILYSNTQQSLKLLIKYKYTILTIIVVLGILSIVFSLYNGNWDMDGISSEFFTILLCLLGRIILILYLVISVINLYKFFKIMYFYIKNNMHLIINSLIIICKNKNSVRFLYAMVYLTMLFIFILHCYRFIIYTSENAFWNDEVFFIRVSNMQIHDLVKASINDCNPPLHYILTRILILIFGPCPVVYRFFSFFPYVVCFFHGFYFLKKNFNILSGFLWTVLVSTTYYSQYHMMDARMYYLEFMFLYFMCISIFNIFKSNRMFDYIILTISAILALYTHTYSTIFVFSIYLMLLLLFNEKKNIIRVFAVYVLTFFAYLPWVKIFFDQFNTVAGTVGLWISKVNTFDMFKNFYLFRHDNVEIRWDWYIYIVLYLINTYIQLNIILKKELKNNFINKFMIASCFSVIAPIVISQLISKIYRPMLVFRYIFPLSCFVFVFTIVLCNQFRIKKVILLILSILSLSIGIYNIKFDCIERKNVNINFHETINTINYQLNGNDDEHNNGVLLVNQARLTWEVCPYLFPNNKVRLIDNLQLNDADFEKPLILALEYSNANQVADIFSNQHNVRLTLLVENGAIEPQYNVPSFHVNVYKVEKEY